MTLYANPTAGGTVQSADQLSDLSEKIWHDMSEQVPLDQIDHLVVEAAAQFEDATVTTFIPLLIQRQVRQRLHAEIGVETLLADSPEPQIH